jgi:hypothetical protein
MCHHDEITSTSAPHVIDDFISQITTLNEDIESIIADVGKQSPNKQ